MTLLILLFATLIVVSNAATLTRTDTHCPDNDPVLLIDNFRKSLLFLVTFASFLAYVE
jgi:hypothetical protein